MVIMGAAELGGIKRVRKVGFWGIVGIKNGENE
jgi:hypothetical protein